MRTDIMQAHRGQIPRWGHDGLPRPYWRVYHNATPGWAVQQGRRRVSLDPQNLLLIAPDTTYVGFGPMPADHLWVHATGDGAMAGALPGIHVLPCAGGLLELCATIRPNQDPVVRRLHAAALVLHAIGLVADRLAPPIRHGAAVTAAIALGERCLHRRVGNDEFARVAGMHRTAFIRRFRSETGLTPQAWHQRQRIAAACLALERGDETIEAIAAALGYCDRHHFGRIFSALRGCSPGAYRRTAAGSRT